MTPGALEPVDAAEAAAGADDLDEVELVDLNLESMVWTGRRRLGSSRVSDLVVGDWKARAASIVDSVVERADVVTLSAAESGWWNVEVQHSRIAKRVLLDDSVQDE